MKSFCVVESSAADANLSKLEIKNENLLACTKMRVKMAVFLLIRATEFGTVSYDDAKRMISRFDFGHGWHAAVNEVWGELVAQQNSE
ncbi:hypothetical protein HN954_04825 [bacterium]|nr:hypothetical protein [bacterium]MBT6832009.1 hypothetical protein [bacterium]MBT6996719.1 hypothetical protein [bacterium]MBT7772687.1 hypothetical protein [bacterium]